MLDNVLDSLWIEKYRPKTMDDIVIGNDLRKKVEEWGKEGSIPHLLFVGSAGIGKTSLAHIIVDEVLKDCECLPINGSDEGGIDVIRSKVKSFASSASLDGEIKVVIFGEADGMTVNAQDSLNEIIESCSSTTRFIFTANDISKLTKPLVSRCQRYNINIEFKDYVKACLKVLVAEGISPKEEFKFITDVCKSKFPDIRGAIGELQKSVVGGVIKPNVEAVSSFVGDLWNVIRSKTPEEIRSFYIEQSAEYSDVGSLMISLSKHAFVNYEVGESRTILPILNKFLVNDTMVVDRELNFFCMILELKNALK